MRGDRVHYSYRPEPLHGVFVGYACRRRNWRRVRVVAVVVVGAAAVLLWRLV